MENANKIDWSFHEGLPGLAGGGSFSGPPLERERKS